MNFLRLILILYNVFANFISDYFPITSAAVFSI